MDKPLIGRGFAANPYLANSNDTSDLARMANRAAVDTAGSSNRVAGTSNQAAVDTAGTSNRAAGTSNQAAGTSNQAAGTSNQAAGTSNQAAAAPACRIMHRPFSHQDPGWPFEPSDTHFIFVLRPSFSK